MAAVKYAPNSDLTATNKQLSNRMRNAQNIARVAALDAIGAPDDLGVTLPRGLQLVIEAQTAAVALFDQYLREAQG